MSGHPLGPTGVKSRVWWRKPGGGGAGPAGGARSTTEIRADDGEGERRPVVCRACGHVLTHTDARISVAGSHLHTFMNPAGFVFEIACYRDAPGARNVGEPSAEWSWFPGHAWQVALCGRCSVHIGWSFRSGASGHVGLVRDRISTS